jgi:dipeptidase E
VKLLLTSACIRNTSIRTAFVEMLGKPIDESSVLVVPTGIYPVTGGAGMARQAICGRVVTPLCGVGWKSLGVLELTADPRRLTGAKPRPARRRG